MSISDCRRWPARGSAAEWSGQLAAMLFSLLATLERWQVNPRTWLRWYLEACASAGGKVPESVSGYLPWNLSVRQRAALQNPQGECVRSSLPDSS